MAGELRFRLFDVDRYQEILPCLDELARTRSPSDAAVATMKLALARPDERPEPPPGGLEAVERILRNRELEPRVFLSPTSLNGAITAVVELLCFEEGGRSSLVERVGASWVVLEASLRALHDQRWFQELASGRWPGSAELAYPRGEVASFMLTRAGLDELLAGLRTASGMSDLDQYAREEVEGLMALVARAQSVKRWTLEYSSLL